MANTSIATVVFWCILMLTTCLSVSQAETVASFPTCNLTSQEFSGFTYTMDGSDQRVWSHCGFPNPLYEMVRCGWPSTDTARRYVCDPDGILDLTDATKIDDALRRFENNSSRQCNQENSIAGFVIVNRTRVADVNSKDVCINKCGELHPLAATSTAPSEDDMQTVMENFAYNIRRQWKLGSCQNDIIIFYWAEYTKMHISYGDQVNNEVPVKTLTDSLNAAMNTIAQNDSSSQIAEAVDKMLTDFIPTFSLTQPATILFIVNFCVLFVFTLFLIAFTNMSRKEYDMWGVELHWQILGKVVYYLSGLWVIELIFKGILWVQSQSLAVILIFPVSLCLLCLVGFVIVLVQ